MSLFVPLVGCTHVEEFFAVMADGQPATPDGIYRRRTLQTFHNQIFRLFSGLTTGENIDDNLRRPDDSGFNPVHNHG